MTPQTLEEQTTDSPYVRYCQDRLQALPAEIAEAQRTVIALSRRLGELEKGITENLPLARARKATRKRIYLVNPNDPETIAQTSWTELWKTSKEFVDAVRHLESLHDERKRNKHSIEYSVFLREYIAEHCKGDAS